MFFPGTNGGPSEETRELVDAGGPPDRRRVLRRARSTGCARTATGSSRWRRRCSSSETLDEEDAYRAAGLRPQAARRGRRRRRPSRPRARPSRRRVSSMKERMLAGEPYLWAGSELEPEYWRRRARCCERFNAGEEVLCASCSEHSARTPRCVPPLRVRLRLRTCRSGRGRSSTTARCSSTRRRSPSAPSARSPRTSSSSPRRTRSTPAARRDGVGERSPRHARGRRLAGRWRASSCPGVTIGENTVVGAGTVRDEGPPGRRPRRREPRADRARALAVPVTRATSAIEVLPWPTLPGRPRAGGACPAHGDLGDLVGRRALDGEVADLVGDAHDLVEAEAALVAGAAAAGAALRARSASMSSVTSRKPWSRSTSA